MASIEAQEHSILPIRMCGSDWRVIVAGVFPHSGGWLPLENTNIFNAPRFSGRLDLGDFPYVRGVPNGGLIRLGMVSPH